MKDRRKAEEKELGSYGANVTSVGSFVRITLVAAIAGTQKGPLPWKVDLRLSQLLHRSRHRPERTLMQRKHSQQLKGERWALCEG